MTSLSLFTFLHWRRKWQPTPVFLPGESQGRGSLVGCRLWGRKGSERLMRLSSSVSSLEKCQFSSLAHFLIGLFVFLVLSYMSCLYILKINSLPVALFAIIFSHSEGHLFTLLIVSFIVQKLLSLIRSYLFIFVFYFHYSLT